MTDLTTWVTDARDALNTRANGTDLAVFENMVKRARSLSQRDITGKPKVRRQKDAHATREIIEELALILSWRLGWTRTFWSEVAYAVARGE